MARIRLAGRAGAFLISIAVIVAACGSATSSGASPSPAANASSAATPSGNTGPIVHLSAITGPRVGLPDGVKLHHRPAGDTPGVLGETTDVHDQTCQPRWRLAHHYHIDSTTIVGGFTGLPAGAVIDTWIADAGYLVAFEATGLSSGSVSIEVTNVNDPANKVDRPS